MKKYIFLSVFVFLVFCCNIIFAQGSKKDTWHPKKEQIGLFENKRHGGLFVGDPEMMKEELDLEDRQVEAISAINLKFKKKLMEIDEKLFPKRIKLARLLLDDDVSLKDVRLLLNDIKALEIDIRMLQIEHRLEIEKILTQTQRNKLRNFMIKDMGPGMGPMPAMPHGMGMNYENIKFEKGMCNPRLF